MGDISPDDSEVPARRLKQQASRGDIRVSLHAHEEMVDEKIPYESVREALLDGAIIEDYADHRRGPCCLVCGQCASGRYLHIVCTTSLEVVIIITAYEPKPPKWITPYQRTDNDEM